MLLGFKTSQQGVIGRCDGCGIRYYYRQTSRQNTTVISVPSLENVYLKKKKKKKRKTTDQRSAPVLGVGLGCGLGKARSGNLGAPNRADSSGPCEK